MSSRDIGHNFAYHPAVTQEKQDAHAALREAIEKAASFVDYEVPVGREQALALTKLEEAMFWANAAIAREV